MPSEKSTSKTPRRGKVMSDTKHVKAYYRVVTIGGE